MENIIIISVQKRNTPEVRHLLQNVGFCQVQIVCHWSVTCLFSFMWLLPKNSSQVALREVACCCNQSSSHVEQLCWGPVAWEDIEQTSSLSETILLCQSNKYRF